MIITAKDSIYKQSDLSKGVLLNLEIRDINTYYNRFEDSLNFVFGVFQNIDNELIPTSIIVLKIDKTTQRTGYVQMPDVNNTGDTTQAIEEYFEVNGNLDGVTVLDYGMPSVELAKTFFTGGSLDNSEIEPTNDLAKLWLLNTLKFDGQPIANNFKF